MSSWRARAALFAVLLFAFALRVANLDAQGIWGDEAFSIFTARQNIAFVLSGGADTHPPLYHFLLHYWMLLAGFTPFALRYLSVFWGLLTVVAGWKLSQIGLPVRDKRLEISAISNLSIVLLALSPFLIYYAQETRMYAQVAALCTLSLLFLVRWQANGKGLAAWSIVTLLAIYSHYFAFFVLAAEDLYLLWCRWSERRMKDESSLGRDEQARLTRGERGGRRKGEAVRQVRTMVVMQALLALLYVPWVIEQYGYLTHQANTRLSTLSLHGIWDVISKSLGALFIGTTLDGALQVPAALICLALAVIGFVPNRWSVRANAPTDHTTAVALLALVIVVPILGAIAVNPLLPFFRERFLLIASPAYIVLMTLGITYFAQRRASLFLLISLVSLLLFSILALSNYWYNPAYHKGEYDQAIAAIRAAAQPTDAVLVYSPMQDAIYDYYRIPDLDSFALPKADLDAIRSTHPRAWLLLYGDPASYDPSHSAEQYLSAHGFKAFYRSYRDGALARYDFTSEGVQVANKHIRFGDAITLSGYALPGIVAKGSTLGVTLQWRTSVPLVENYTVFVHVLGVDGKVAAQMDTPPAGGTRPTRSWQPSETIRDNIGIAIVNSIPPGHYQVEVGMYQLQTLQRLPVVDADSLSLNGDAVIIGIVDIY
jgi:hypothetical protein